MALIFVVVFMLSIAFTGLIRQYAIARNIVDVPNHRSSHQSTTPRAGGIAFVVLFLMMLPELAYFKLMSNQMMWALIGSGLLVASLGLIDDFGHIAAKWRLLGHFFAVGLALYCLGGMPTIYFLSWTLIPGTVSNVLAVLYLVWLINLYNFMDGINGIASIEALTACLAMVFIYWITGSSTLMLLPLILAASVTGFLVWNFPFARIFMGDVGSGFLGVVLGVLSIQGAHVNPPLFYSWLIMLGVFIVDATLTLFLRMVRGETLYEAHCTHAYQHAANRLKKHTPVTLAVLAINAVWLFPMACFVGVGYIDGVWGLIIAYLPLLYFAVRLKAGRRDLVI
jgi:Fuc2NAc and GlcNAc transferase